MKNINTMILPRLLRAKGAYEYVGLSRHTFNEKVRPYLTEIKCGYRILLYDRVELDGWVEYFKVSNGRPPKKKGGMTWPEDATGLGLSKERTRPIGTSMELCSVQRYEEALKRATKKSPK